MKKSKSTRHLCTRFLGVLVLNIKKYEQQSAACHSYFCLEIYNSKKSNYIVSCLAPDILGVRINQTLSCDEVRLFHCPKLF